MFNKDFYPTPEHIALKMCQKVPYSEFKKRKVLEPSAGKGDLAYVIYKYKHGIYEENHKFKGYVQSFYESEERDKQFPDTAKSKDIDVIEKEFDLCAILKENRYNIVDKDFLDFFPQEMYNLIIMNPPFSNGDEHLLHAWEILEYGDIVCLLNAETVNNPYSKKRVLLKSIIDNNGTVEFLGDCFSDAERKTGVEIALVHLKKQRKESKSFISPEGFETDAKRDFSGSVFSDNNIAERNVIGNQVYMYEKAHEVFLNVAKGLQELFYYTNACGGMTDEEFKNVVSNLNSSSTLKDRDAEAEIENAHRKFNRKLKKTAWKDILNKAGTKNYASEKVQKEVENLLDSYENLSFSEKNVYSFIDTIFQNRQSILKQTVLDAFDHLTLYYNENRVHVEGWKTNDAWRVNRKVIIPNFVVYDWGSFRINYHRTEIMNDIDRALSFLEGKKLSDIKVTLRDAFYSVPKDGFTENDYFTIKCYKKGTCHMTFKDEELWKMFNFVASECKNWLPDDVKAREREERKRNKYANKFGLEA